MDRPLPLLAAVLVLVVPLSVVAVGPALAQEQGEGTVVGQPSLAVAAADATVVAGREQTVTLTLSNAGRLVRGGPERFENRVTTARNVQVSVATDRLDAALADGLEIERGQALYATVGAGETVQVPLRLRVRGSLAPGEYTLPVRVSYEYTPTVQYGGSDPVYVTRETDALLTATLVVDRRPRLVILNASSEGVAPGSFGRYRLRIANNGTSAAADVGIRLRTANSSVYFGSVESPGATTAVFIDRLDPGETRTIEVTAGSYLGTTPGTYLVNVTARYGTPRTADDLQFSRRVGIRVAQRPQYAGLNTPPGDHRPTVRRPVPNLLRR